MSNQRIKSKIRRGFVICPHIDLLTAVRYETANMPLWVEFLSIFSTDFSAKIIFMRAERGLAKYNALMKFEANKTID